MNDTRKLLDDYVKNGSEPAFRELVARYTDLVHSTARRLVNGDAHLAQDIAQTVFVDLARKASTLSGDVTLGGWLHRHTCFVAASTLRRHLRRESRERHAVAMNPPEDHTAANLARVAPVLDEAINQLDAEDRAAILLRFFEQREFRAVGEALGGSEDAARMRVNRALEKLQLLLRNRGVALSAGALGTLLAAEAVTAAPAGLSALLAGTALAGATAGGATGGLLKFMSITKLKIGLASVLAAAAMAVPLVVQHQSLAGTRLENAGLRQRVDELSALPAEVSRLSNLVANLRSSTAASDTQLRDLARLRGEVTLLREATNDLARAAQSPRFPGFGFGKRIFRGTTMAEFAQFISEVLHVPVADQTGLTGTYDLALTPPRIGGVSVEKTTRILFEDLGLQLSPFDGPFTAAELGVGSDQVHGFALRVDHPAPGLKPASSDPDPFGLGDQSPPMVAQEQAGAPAANSPPQTGPATLANACINNLRQIDGAKQQWALEMRKQPTATPEWSDIQPYLGRGARGELPVCPEGGTYTAGRIADPPTCSIPGHVLN